MTVPLTPLANRLPATVAIPADTEAVNSASVAQYVQPILDALKYSDPAASMFWNGAIASPSGDWGCYTDATHSIQLNNLFLPCATNPATVLVQGAQGLEVQHNTLVHGNLSVEGTVQGMQRVVQGNGAAGVHTYTYAAGTVWHKAATVTAGCIARIVNTPASGDANNAWCISFTNFSTTSVAIQDAAGNALGSVRNSSTGDYIKITFAWNGTTWDAIDVTVKP